MTVPSLYLWWTLHDFTGLVPGMAGVDHHPPQGGAVTVSLGALRVALARVALVGCCTVCTAAPQRLHFLTLVSWCSAQHSGPAIQSAGVQVPGGTSKFSENFD